MLAGAVGLLWVGWLVAALALDAYGQRGAPTAGSWDAIVVAGCKVMPNGQPSPSLERRVRRAVGLWRAGRAPLLVFTGGVGTYPPAEAEASARLALSLGVPEAAIVREARSTTTAENARFAAELVTARRILVVSDTYHVFRCERLFGRHFDAVRGVGSTPEAYPRARFALREVLAVIIEALRGGL